MIFHKSAYLLRFHLILVVKFGLEYFVGVDWSSRDHQVCVVDMEGKVCAQRSFKHFGMGLTEMADWIVRTTQSAPHKVGVAIETPRGPVVESLVLPQFGRDVRI